MFVNFFLLMLFVLPALAMYNPTHIIKYLKPLIPAKVRHAAQEIHQINHNLITSRGT